MANTQKPKRSYNSTRRRQQARETRRQILEAANLLFTEHGYSGATIETIAQEAGVAPETVYSIFGNKRTILAQVIDFAVGGDDEPIALMQRPEVQAVLRASDPVRQLQLFAEDISRILERVAPLFIVLRGAARTEPEIAELLDALLAERLRNLENFVHHLTTTSQLRSGLSDTEASENVWTLTSPEVFNLLTVDRGWTNARYVNWLEETLVRLLLP